MQPDSGDIVAAATRVTIHDAAIAAKAQNTYESENAAAQVAAQEAHFWRAIMGWCNQSEDCDCLRETEKTFMCEDTALVSADWLTAAEAALTAQGFTVTRDANTRKFTVGQA